MHAAARRRTAGTMIIQGEPAGVAASPPVRPSRRWYWVAGGILAGAVICIAFALAGFFSLTRQIEDFQRVSVPGQAEVTFARPGRYVLYIEEPGHCCSFSVGSGDSAPFSNWSMNVGLQPVNGGPPVAISSSRGAIESYGVAGHQGQSAMSFTIGQPGRYVLAASEVTPASIVDVAVGRGIRGGVFVPIVLGLAGLFALVAGLVIGLVTAFRRRRARRRLLSAAGGGWHNGGSYGEGEAMGQVVPIPGAEKPAKIRSPFAPALLPFITFAIYLFFWWYFINREMADYGKAKGSGELGDSPGKSVLAITLGALIIVPAIISTINTFKRVQEAQRLAGQEQLNGWIGLILYLVISPAFYAYLQSGLNEVWRAEVGRIA